MSYDVFLSHNHHDKAWVRELFATLARHDYNGRSLRPWLDERVLDPGELSSSRELFSALDRCRFLVVVASPEAMASAYVRQEVKHFVGARGAGDVLVLRRRPCELFPELSSSTVIDWPDETDDDEGPRAAVVDFLCPSAGYDEPRDRKDLRKLWMAALYAQQLAGSPTRQNRELLERLLAPDISNLASEGPALVGFDRVAELLVDVSGADNWALMMAVGEFVALAILRDHRYRQVLPRFVELETKTRESPSFLVRRTRLHDHRGQYGHANSNLLFAVARAASKLAEVDLPLVDLCGLWSVLEDLDGREDASRDEKALTMLVGRTLGKLRNTTLGDLVLHALARSGGRASHGAIETAVDVDVDDSEAGVFYTEELEAAVSGPGGPVGPPRPSIAGLVRDGRFAGVASSLSIWPAVEIGPNVKALVNGPLVGRVQRIDLDNMETIGPRLGPTDLACLVEPRVVDDLLTRAGGFLIAERDPESPLAQRLRSRRSRYAMIDADEMARLGNGDCVAVAADGSSLRVGSSV